MELQFAHTDFKPPLPAGAPPWGAPPWENKTFYKTQLKNFPIKLLLIFRRN
jgi:hypothetical protein